MPRSSAPSSQQVSLRQKVVHGTKWHLIGHVFSQFWRLAANLILARLLLREAFGIMAMINVFIYSLQMLSDVGLRDTVIHNDRGDEPEFLNTVWTIQAIRGFGLFGVVCLGAIPFSSFYGIYELRWLLVAAGLTAPIRGFCSTSMLTAGRHINPKWNVAAEIGGSVVGSVVTIGIAIFWRDVWTMVIGLIVSAIAFTLISYRFGSHHRHRFQWDREAAKAVSSFGRWVIPSSALTILLRRGDTIVLGKVMSTATLGVYTIGANLAVMPLHVFGQLSGSILQPVYAKTRDIPLAEARSKIRQLRFALCGACLAGLWGMILLSYWLFFLLYKPEFLEAYKFCQIVAFGITLRITTDMGPVFQGYGLAHRHFILVCVRSFATVLAMYLGFVFATPLGLETHYGVVWGAALAPLVYYPIQSFMYRQIGMWQPEIEALGVVPAVCFVAYVLMQRF